MNTANSTTKTKNPPESADDVVDRPVRRSDEHRELRSTRNKPTHNQNVVQNESHPEPLTLNTVDSTTKTQNPPESADDVVDRPVRRVMNTENCAVPEINPVITLTVAHVETL